MKLVANECANCRRPLGYVTPEALQIPTFCILCAADKEVMKLCSRCGRVLRVQYSDPVDIWTTGIYRTWM